MQRIIIIGVSLLLLGCSQQSIDVAHRISHLSDPKDFATAVYAQVFANQYQTANFKNERELAKQFFTDNLLHLLESADRKTARVGEVGCLNFQIFTDAQDTLSGFLIGGVKKNHPHTIVSVYLGLNQNDFIKPRLDLYLINTVQGWRIADIVYHSLHESLYSVLAKC